jgi:hypothetical protein
MLIRRHRGLYKPDFRMVRGQGWILITRNWIIASGVFALVWS